ncbi:MAG TPA: NfeD family protein [Burkholderiaceae bacterium]|nr:NfeD family protein [Burkholderiaceae bacterium]
MTWWAWILGGAIMLGAELAFVDAQFYLVFIGAAAIIVGAGVAAVSDVPTSAQWIAFSVLAIVSMVTFRRRIYVRLRGRTPQVSNSPVGGALVLPRALAPGESCQVEHAGTFWTVQNEGRSPLAAGVRVRIARVEGLTLLVRAEA